MLLISLLLCFPSDVDHFVQRKQYYSAAKLLQPKARSLEDPVALREYTVLLTEFYSRQIGWRTFFIKNLEQDERLDVLRGGGTAITKDTIGQVMEDNLEQLLIDAEKRYPDDLNIAFAKASYVFRGRCCLVSPELTVKPSKAMEIFREADKKDIRSPGSMLALALEHLKRGDEHQSAHYFSIGESLAPNDFELKLGSMNQELRKGNYPKALLKSRQAFNLGLDPQAKADALGGAARAEFAMGNHKAALETARNTLKLMPSYNLAFFVALDSLRALNDDQAYGELVTSWWAQSKTRLFPFRGYLDYLNGRGVKDLDLKLISDYQKEKYSDSIEELTRLANLTEWFLFRQDQKSAEKFLKKMKKIARQFNSESNEFQSILSRLEDRVKTLKEK